MKILVRSLSRYSQRGLSSVPVTHILSELEILDVRPQSGVTGRMREPTIMAPKSTENVIMDSRGKFLISK